MSIPIVSAYRALERAPREFLLFMVFNVISWECIAGSALVLFARRIDMPPSWVGMLLSFMPLSQILVVFMVPLVTRWGSKRLMYRTWLFRNMMACCVFIMPWAIVWWGPHAAWYVLLASTLGFCLARSIGVGGWFPWLHEVVPEHQRGLYFSCEAGVSRFVVACVTLAEAMILWNNPGLNRYLLVYSFGIASGLFSLVWMNRVPGGAGNPNAISVGGSYGAYRRAFRDRRFIGLVLTASFCVSCFAWFGSSVIMYMRDQLGMSDVYIMSVVALGSVGVLLSISSWMRFTEHHGSGYTMFLALSGHCALASVFFVLLPQFAWTRYVLVAVFVALSILGAAFWVSMNRAMLNCINPDNRAAYSGLWGLGTSMASGVTPILAGHIIGAFGMWGFRTCFAIAVIGGLIGAVISRVVVRDGKSELWDWQESLSFFGPFRGLARIVLVTVGLDRSNA